MHIIQRGITSHLVQAPSFFTAFKISSNRSESNGHHDSLQSSQSIIISRKIIVIPSSIMTSKTDHNNS